MAHIEFKKDQPIQALSGTLGPFNFRTINGQTYVHALPVPVLPKNPTRQQREQFKQRTLINKCIYILQSQIPDIQEAIAMRSILKKRLTKLYKKYAQTIKTSTKLQRTIMSEYYAHFGATSSGQCRENIGTSSRLKRDEILNS